MPDSKATILIAEDEACLRDLLYKILERGGYNVLAAEDGQGALRIAREHKNEIDMLVSDVQMPGMIGPDLARELRRFLPNLPVLLISGHSEGVLLLDAGWSFLHKPYLPRAILDKVQQMLNDAALSKASGARSRLHEELEKASQESKDATAEFKALIKDVPSQVLKAELEKAWQENKAATEAFNSIANQVPSLIPDPDGSLRIRQAGARMNDAIRVHMLALKRYVEFVTEHSMPDRPDD